MGRVWVVGSLNVDKRWRVERHPTVGETIFGQVLPPAPGGKGLNQAVAAARMGAEVRLVGRVGADDDGRELVARAVAEGIDVSFVEVADDATITGTALIVIDADGANTVTVDPGANAGLVVSAERPLGIAAGDVVVAQLEVPAEAVAAAFAEARAVGATCVLNPSPIGDEGWAVAQAADVVVLNEHEAYDLAGPAAHWLDTADRIEIMCRPGQHMIATLGAEGAIAVGKDREGALVGSLLRIEGSATTAVDTTGAGDCFLGVLAAGLADGLGFQPSIVRANQAAAISVGRLGAVAAMPTADEVDAELATED